MIPAGRYVAQAVSSTTGLSPVKGTPYIEVWLRILEGNHQGEAVRWVGYWNENTWDNTAKALAAFGFTGEDPGVLHELRGDECADMLPRRVNITVAFEEGEPMVRWVNLLRDAAGQDFPGFRAKLLEQREAIGLGPIPQKRKSNVAAKPEETPDF